MLERVDREPFEEDPTSVYGYELDDPDDTPEKHLEFLKSCVEAYRAGEFDLEALFSSACNGPFEGDVDKRGVFEQTGHVIYRLSDYVDPDVRRGIAIYPAAPEIGFRGEIIRHGIQWQSLEQWRKEWSESHPVIPEFVKKLAEGFQLNPGIDNSQFGLKTE